MYMRCCLAVVGTGCTPYAASTSIVQVQCDSTKDSQHRAVFPALLDLIIRAFWWRLSVLLGGSGHITYDSISCTGSAGEKKWRKSKEIAEEKEWTTRELKYKGRR